MRLFLIAGILLVTSPLHAASLWDHNGSAVKLEANGSRRQFVYEKPQDGIPASRGAILFQGSKSANEYKGTAFVFSSRCGRKGFDASGPVSADQRSVTLYGKSPILGAACEVTGYRDVVLTFSLAVEPTKFALKLGTTAFGFHIPQKYDGQTIYAVPPSNEHTVYSVEDMYSTIGARLDVLVAETDAPINNAYAVVDGTGETARRLIVFDNNWFSQISHKGGAYRVILAHEIGHHVCRHTLGEFRAQPLERELQADQAAGAILRKAHDAGHGIGGGTVDLNGIIDTARVALGVEDSATHPAQAKRIAALVDGWNRGSPCLDAKYETINLPPPREISAAERIVLRYGSDLVWSHNHWSGGHSYVRTEVTGNRLRIVFDNPSPQMARNGVRRGMTLFEGATDRDTITGTLTYYPPGCAPVTYPASGGKFVENNFLMLVGPPPKMAGCNAAGSYNDTVHLFKNTSDFGFEPPASR